MKLVAVTGYGRDDDRRRTKDAGFVAHLVKPIELNGGQGAERLAEQYGITREAMDRWALRSHERAIAAQWRLLVLLAGSPE